MKLEAELTEHDSEDDGAYHQHRRIGPKPHENRKRSGEGHGFGKDGPEVESGLPIEEARLLDPAFEGGEVGGRGRPAR